MLRKVALVGAGVLAGVGLASWVQAQAPGEIKRAMLLTVPLAAKGYNGVVGRGEVPAGMAGPAHFHHGDELVVLLEGEVEVEVEGAKPLRMKAGEAMHIEAGKIHKPKSVGPVPAKFISVWVVEKDKPFAVNAP